MVPCDVSYVSATMFPATMSPSFECGMGPSGRCGLQGVFDGFPARLDRCPTASIHCDVREATVWVLGF